MLEGLQSVSNRMNDIPGRCQCLKTCPNRCIKGEAFCENHKDSCPREAPLSGSEPKYDPERWNKDKAVRLTHNCFSYSFNIIDKKQIDACLKNTKCYTAFHQPGSISGFPKFTDVDPKTCPNMIGRLFGDNPSKITPSTFDERCQPGTSKIALVVDQDQDYHFLRQDAPSNNKNQIGYFSQKSGAMPVTDKDALGNKIFDVELAYHNFYKKGKEENLNYDILCGYFCVSRNSPLFIKVGGRRIPKAKGKGRYSHTRRR